MLPLVWLVPALPLAGFLVNGLVGRRLGKGAVTVVGPGSVGLAFAVAVAIFLELLALPPHERFYEIELFRWIPSGDLQIPVGLQVDPLSTVMMLVVTGV